MFIIFTVSLLLLVAFFGLKIKELNRGDRLFFNSIRRQADVVVAKKIRAISRSLQIFYHYICDLYADLGVRIRNRLSSWLEQLAHKLRS
ncbi:MAG: hypothetical protein WD335_02775 [Candidatus Paceibacterota bacterium]